MVDLKSMIMQTKVIFVSERLKGKISQEVYDKMTLIIEVDTFKVLKADDEKFTCDGKTSIPTPDDIATIIYTSGTTGNSKGVMLSHKNLSSHLKSAMQLRPSFEWDVWLSILPLSHTLENSLSLLLPFSSGSSVYYLDKAPTPSALLQASR